MAGETTRDVVIRIKTEYQAGALPKGGGAGGGVGGGAKDSVDSAEKSKREAAREERKRIADIAKAHRDERKKAAEEARNIASAERQEVENKQKMLAAAGKIGEGVAKIVRGISLAFVDGDEEAGQIVETVAGIQSSFDAFTGTIQTIHGLSEGIGSMAKVSTTAATASKGLAASNLAVATTAGTAKTAMIAFMASLGPEVLLIAAISAAVSALMADAEKTSDQAMKKAERLRKAKEALESSVGYGRDRRLGQRDSDVAANMVEATIGKLDTAKLEEKSALFTKAFKGLGDQWASTSKRIRESDSIADRGSILGLELQIDDRRELVGIIQSHLDLAKRVNDVFREGVELQKQETAAAREGYMTAKDKLDLEEKRQRSLSASLGEMSAGDRSRLKRIGTKVESGRDLSVSELKFVRERGGEAGAEFAEKGFAKRGDTFGGAGAFDFLSPGASSKDKLASLRTSVEGWSDFMGEQNTLLGQFDRAAKEAFEQNKKSIEAMTATMVSVKDELANLQRGFKLQKQ